MINTVTDAGVCPECQATTETVRDAVPWCPRCEWNLDTYDPARRAREFGWNWVDRWTHRVASRMTRQQFTHLAGRPLGGKGSNRVRLLTTVVSLLLLAMVLALAIAGGWLIVAFPFPNLAILPGVAMIGLAVALRPRFGRLDPEMEVLSRHRAPELFALIDEVAAAIDAPMPDVVGVDNDINAYATTVGLRRRTVLCLGLPLWGSLSAGERVALLGHELGHFVNGDPRRGLLTQPALIMLGSAADLFRPVRTTVGGGLVEMIGDALGRAFQWTVSRILFVAHLLLVVVALRDSQRAEYLADELAAGVAGTTATSDLLDALLAAESMALVVGRETRAGHGADRWRSAFAESRAANAARLPLLRQLSVRDGTSLFSTHPPIGLRRRMLTDRPWRDSSVVLTEASNERIDTELAKEYERFRRTVSWSA
ncbi:M48 family metallopeptidase [Micromonospora sp. WMMD1120]|uniref:M48 family metallopeptidase n=1 Tax=Micromonospora sp. WMMD1120 TaxID=3016106 RepID=UPI002415AF5A|nr:M48 family metallopeptidase [Micromonospora sp. WMMD1120]MDG4805466.1 M48 family metallopeptidase [Micromonospora sp. WMMD1120]